MAPSLRADNSDNSRRSSSHKREELHFSVFEFGWPLAFMLSATMCGLKLYFAWLFILVILINRFINNKYDFIIMLTILGCGMQLIDLSDLYFPTSSVIFCISVIIFVLFKRKGIMKQLSWWLLIYLCCLIWIAHYSLESLPKQMTGLLRYMMVISFIIPVSVFSGLEFDIRYFFKRVLVFAFLFAGFFMMDVCIFNGAFLLPRDQSWIYYEMASDIENINIMPFAFIFPRRWPQGLYIYILCIYPLARMYKLSIFQWLWLVIPIGLSRTFTYTIGLVITYFCCIGTPRQWLKYAIVGLVGFTALYFIDAQFPEYDGSSTLRIKSSVDQFLYLDLDKADEEDLAELGSTRGAQIIPKIEHLLSMGKQWVGFGFIRSDSNIQAYVIENDLYNNPDMAEELATGVESMPFQIVLTIGIIGLVIVLAFYIGISWLIRKLPHCGYFNSVLWCLFIIGASGFGGWIVPDTLYILALSLGVVIMDGRTSTSDFAPLRPYYPGSRL